MVDAVQMIEAIGGVRKTAAKLGIPPTTVQHWKSHCRVPAWRESDLKAAYEAASAPEAA